MRIAKISLSIIVLLVLISYGYAQEEVEIIGDIPLQSDAEISLEAEGEINASDENSTTDDVGPAMSDMDGTEEVLEQEIDLATEGTELPQSGETADEYLLETDDTTEITSESSEETGLEGIAEDISFDDLSNDLLDEPEGQGTIEVGEEAELDGEPEEDSEEKREYSIIGFGVSASGLELFTEFGNGKLVTLGVAYSLYGGIIIPQISVGYTPSEEDGFFYVKHRGISVSFMIYSKLLQIVIVPDIHIYVGLGADFSFFSESKKMVSGLYLTQGFEMLDLGGKVKNIGFEIRESLYFEQSNPAFFTFQLGFSIRMGFFAMDF